MEATKKPRISRRGFGVGYVRSDLYRARRTGLPRRGAFFDRAAHEIVIMVGMMSGPKESVNGNSGGAVSNEAKTGAVT